jgi:heme/copper-type cytochrome/quinol oxidase subunit 2
MDVNPTATAKENDMAWQILFSTDVGLLSLFTIVFIICMAIFLFNFVRTKVREDTQRLKKG